MPSPSRHLGLPDLERFVRAHVFGAEPADPGAEPADRHGFGIELEWLTLVGPAGDRLPAREAEALVRELAPLPGRGRLTVEPGGQLEISSAPASSLDGALAAVALDLHRLEPAARARGIELVAVGADPRRAPTRVVRSPRYDAMERYFTADDGEGRPGVEMMCNTASLQVNVGLGPETGVADRWRLANALGPALVAAFANSPFTDGQPSGFRSFRQHTWLRVDPGRAAPPSTHEPVRDFLAYALDAPVMFVACRPDDVRSMTDRRPFRQWLSNGHELGWPTLDDFRLHLSTLFPPVRPRGWFELRMLDVLPTPFWHVACALVHAILTRPEAVEPARAAVRGTEDRWIDAAEHGLQHPDLAAAADRLFAVASEVIDADAGYEAVRDVFGLYRERWVGRRRCPADDLLDAWRRTGALLPPAVSPVFAVDDLALAREGDR